MAKQSIRHECGHMAAHDLFGPNAERDRKIAWLRTVPCLACKRTAEQEAVATASPNLPALTGSDKQVAWAASVRAKQLAVIAAELEKVAGAYDPADAAQAAAMAGIEAAVARITRQAAASWWIDRRDSGTRALLREFVPQGSPAR